MDCMISVRKGRLSTAFRCVGVSGYAFAEYLWLQLFFVCLKYANGVSFSCIARALMHLWDFSCS